MDFGKRWYGGWGCMQYKGTRGSGRSAQFSLHFLILLLSLRRYRVFLLCSLFTFLDFLSFLFSFLSLFSLAHTRTHTHLHTQTISLAHILIYLLSPQISLSIYCNGISCSFIPYPLPFFLCLFDSTSVILSDVSF